MGNKATLVLEDGHTYTGLALGKIGTTTGELCFNTGMTGYQEIYTDPSYFGQILINTHTHIGNYGIIPDDDESRRVQINGLVCSTFSNIYSRKTATDSLQHYFEQAGLVGIQQIDTRALVVHIREKGAMNAIISSETDDIAALQAALARVPSMNGLELSSQVSTAEPYFFGDAAAPYKVAVLDLGIKQNILRNLADRGVYCQVFPAKTPFEQMQAWQPNGYFISNGPGDPSAMPYAVATIQAILTQNKPLFGICLGHQLLALSVGIGTYKLHCGHRGLNHPVKNLLSHRLEITSQNHGFGIVAEDVLTKSEVVIPTHINLNDQTIEGIQLKNKPAFSVQYHPESSPGPHDSRYLFDQFVAMMQAS